jgi:hypothetical protein
MAELKLKEFVNLQNYLKPFFRKKKARKNTNSY